MTKEQIEKFKEVLEEDRKDEVETKYYFVELDMYDKRIHTFLEENNLEEYTASV